MNHPLWCLLALGVLLLQVQPVRATLRMPAAEECCRKTVSCCEHPGAAPVPAAGIDCSACLPCCTGCAILPAVDLPVGAVAATSRLALSDEHAGARRDPPPLPPPRPPEVGIAQ